MTPTPKYDYGFDPTAENQTASAVWRLASSGGPRVLDLGSGPGVVSSALAGKGFDVVCVDNDTEALAVAAERGVQRTVVGDLRTDDWVDQVAGEPYDTVILADVLEHMVDPGDLLRTIHANELLAPDGQIVVSVPNIGHEAVVFGLALGRFRYTPTGLLDETHVRFFTRDSLHALLEEQGFVVRALHRTQRTLEQTEQFQVGRDVPKGLREQLRALAPDSQTYQFVVSASPSSDAGQLAVLRHRLEEERDTHVRALEQLRVELKAGTPQEKVDALARERDQALAALAATEAELAESPAVSVDGYQRAVDERDAARAQLATVRAEVAGVRAEAARAADQASSAAAEARTLRAALKATEDRLDMVYSSTAFKLGWRATSPMRRVKGGASSPVRPPRLTSPDGDDADGPPVAVSKRTAPARPVAPTPVTPDPSLPQSSRRAVYDDEVTRETFTPGVTGVVMLCSTTDLDAGRGDIYAACGLGIGLQSQGMLAVYRSYDRWAELPEGTDIVVSYLAEKTMILDPATIPAGVLRVAWIRNNTQRWIEEGSLGLYDLVLCSSQRTADEIAEHYLGPVEVLALGVDPLLFEPDGAARARETVVSTINQWGRTRRTYRVLAECELDVPVRVYGRANGLDPRLAPHHGGLISYFQVPGVYQSAAIVLDDQQGVNAPYGNVNSRIYEAIAAGALPLTASPLGLDDVGLGDVPVWRNDHEMQEQIVRWTADPEGRAVLVARLRETVLAHNTFDVRAQRFAELVKDLPRRRPSVIGFYPDYRVTNPFQDMVYAGALGRVVRPVESARALLEAPGLQDHQRVFHLHWVATVLGPAREDAVEAQRRADEFLADLDELKAAGIAIVWTVHNVLHHESRHPAIEVEMRRGIAARADLVHVLSAATVAAAADAGYGLPPARTYVGTHPSYIGIYPSGISRAAARRELGLPQDAFVHLVLGQIRPYKGLERVLEAFEGHAAAHPDAHLLVAGLPGKFEGVQELLARAQATPSTTVVAEHVEDERLQVFLRAADVVVLPHRKVLNSGLLWLAWSFGRPVVAPDTGALSDLVDDAVGVLFDPATDDLGPALEESRRLGPEHGREAFRRAMDAGPREVGAQLLAAIDDAAG